MERCKEHMKADGEIERSIKKNDLVERTRRCGKCGSLFKAFELTDDKLAFQQAERDQQRMELERELKYYQEVVENIKAWYEAERTLKVALKGEYGFDSESGG